MTRKASKITKRDGDLSEKNQPVPYHQDDQIQRDAKGLTSTGSALTTSTNSIVSSVR